MEPTDLTVQILREIRDEIRGTNTRLERVEHRLELGEKRQTESELRVATELVALSRSVDQVRQLLPNGWS